jgi:hypothetical protein
MLYKLFRAFAMRHAGLDCRRCGQSIEPGDYFGLSEGVCRACRG